MSAAVPLIGLCLANPLHASVKTTTRASVNALGVAGDQASGGARIAGDGVHVAFHSAATNLVDGDTNGVRDVFVQHQPDGRIVRVSLSSTGAQANQDCMLPSVSHDALVVAFASRADNLVAGDANGVDDVFVRDTVAGTAVCASVNGQGLPGNGPSRSAALSADGRFVAFVSAATDLVAGDTNGFEDVFVRDLLLGTSARVSVGPAGAQADGASVWPTISADGRYVAFESAAGNLDALDTNPLADVFAHDLTTGATSLVNLDSAGVPGGGVNGAPSISGDGRFVAFHSTSSVLITGDTNGKQDVFLRDRTLGLTTIVSMSTNGLMWSHDSLEPAISANGRHVAYRIRQHVTQQFTDRWFIWVRDTESPPWVLDHHYNLNRTLDVMFLPANGDCFSPSLSADGSRAAFDSEASDILHDDTNGVPDVFFHHHSAIVATIATYCSAGTTTHGCSASISGVGTPMSGADHGPFTITVTNVPGQTSGMLFYGFSGPRATPFAGGSSVLCVRAPVQRTPVQSSGGTSGACDGQLTLDWSAFVEATPGILFPGELVWARTVWAQGWFRDPLAPGGSHLSNGLWFTVGHFQLL